MATVIKDEQKQFEENWKSLEYRFKVIPGKEFISALNNKLQNDYKISISYTQIISQFEFKDLDGDLIKLFEQIEKNAS